MLLDDAQELRSLLGKTEAADHHQKAARRVRGCCGWNHRQAVQGLLRIPGVRVRSKSKCHSASGRAPPSVGACWRAVWAAAIEAVTLEYLMEPSSVRARISEYHAWDARGTGGGVLVL